MTPTLIAITGPAASGKNTLGKTLAERLAQDNPAHLISARALFRAAALFTLESGCNPQKPLRADFFSEIEIEQLDGHKVKLSQHRNEVIYSPHDYSTEKVAQAGSSLADSSPDTYTAFVQNAILWKIQSNINDGTHSIVSGRSALAIANRASAPSLCIYLTVKPDAQLKRLEERLSKKPETRAKTNELIHQELKRDQDDIKTGILPPLSKESPLLLSSAPFDTRVTYRFDTSMGTIDDNTEQLYRAAKKFIAKYNLK